MGFIKKYSMLLIPAGIVVVAVVFIALTVLTNRSLAGEIQKNSLASNQQIGSLLSKAVPAEQWQAEKIRMDAFEKDVEAVVQLSQACSMRELISYRIFPKPADASQQVFDEYGARYRAAIEQMIRGMNAMEAPSEMEIRAEIGDGGGRTSVFGTAGPTSYARTPFSSGRGQVDTARQAMIDAVCARRAEQISVYGNPTAFKWYEYWGDFKFAGQTPALVDCWNSQVAFWIYEDVAATIKALNAGSTTVYSSPVKRLLGVGFMEEAGYPTRQQFGAGYSTRPYDRGGFGEGMGGAMRGDAPEYIQYPEGGVLGVAPWTARLCNDEIEVVHFSVGVITSSSAVMPFMKELCSAKEHTYRVGWEENGAQKTGQHNQITILKSDVMPVDPLSAENESYRYGDEAVVRVNLVCEYLFDRAAYDAKKPDKIKEQLGQHQKDGQPADVGGMGGMGGGRPGYPAGPSGPAPAPRAPRRPAREVGGGDF